MVKKSINSLVEYLVNHFSGCTTVSLTYTNVIEHNKIGRNSRMTWYDVFGDREIVKKSFINTLIGSRYSNMVNNQRVREGVDTDDEFKASKAYGEYIVPRVLLYNSNTNTYQLRGYVDSTMTSVNDTTEYRWTDGTIVSQDDWEKIQEFTNIKRGITKQGVTKEIRPRMYNLNKIETIKINGRVFN